MTRRWHSLATDWLASSKLPDEFARLVRFGVVGMVATIVYFSSSIAMVEVVGLPPVAASVVGQLCAIGISYFGHAAFSFRVEQDHNRHAWRFLVTSAGTFGVNILVTWLLTNVMHLPYLIAFSVIVVLIPSINYTCNRFWVFKGGLDTRGRRLPLGLHE